MINKVDHLIVAVKDIEEAENNFSKLISVLITNNYYKYCHYERTNNI